jgi:spore coat polysaccharide biosynthesis predicted glycosyltransferase SpsG
LPSGFAANELSAIVGKKALKDIRKGESISRKVIEQTASVPRLYRRRVAAAVTGGCNPPLTPMPCGFAGKPVKPARQLSNNLSALRASNWTSQFETRKDAAMKAAFRIDAGAQIGMGHFVRMSALAEALTEKGCACDFFTRENEPIDYTGFDIVFVDTYLVTDEYISALNELNALVVCYDENALYKYSCDLLINSNLYANDLKFQFGAKIPQMLLGGKYALLRKEFRERDSILIRKEATRVFICFGGTDVRNCTPDVVACLQALPNIELAVVLGEMTQCDDEVAKVADDHVSIFKNPDSIAEIMRGCDIAVISAGSIVYESAALGLPALLIVQADNQERIAGYMTSNCLMKCVGNWENLSMRYLFDETISLLADYERRYSESGRLRESVDQNGVYNVSNVVLEMKNNQRDTAT